MAKKLLITPFGELVGYPWINKPDAKFSPENPVYKADVAIDAAEADVLVDKLEGLTQEAFANHIDDMPPAKAKQWTIYRPWEDEVDEETGEPTGRIVFRTKQNSVLKTLSGETKEIKVGIRSAADKPMSASVWAGSIARLMFSTRPIEMSSSKQFGLRLDLAMVQVRELAEGRRGLSFGAVEGYTEEEADHAHDEQSSGPGEDVQDY
jgi:hypothetical protein